MPGASKKRGKLDRQGPRGAGQGPAPGPAAPAPAPPAEAAPAEPVAYDGPGDNRGGPSSSKPQGVPGQAGSQDPRGGSPAGASSRPKVDPAKEQSMILNKNVDFPGNAYNLVNQVSGRFVMIPYSRT